MAKYDPLHRFLPGQAHREIAATFAEIDRIVGGSGQPRSAPTHPADRPPAGSPHSADNALSPCLCASDDSGRRASPVLLRSRFPVRWPQRLTFAAGAGPHRADGLYRSEVPARMIMKDVRTTLLSIPSVEQPQLRPGYSENREIPALEIEPAGGPIRTAWKDCHREE